MTGAGTAFGAITVLNGTATGFGCSLAVRDGTTASWRKEPAGFQFEADPVTDAALARAVARRFPGGARIATRSAWPSSRGLKTSSGAATAMVRAASAEHALPLDARRVMELAVQASKEAGVTLTGAWDDQAAVTLGGCHVVGHDGHIWRSLPVPDWAVAVWVPAATIAKRALAGLDARPLAPAIERLERDLTPATIPATLTQNGRLFTQLYSDAGLPVTLAPVKTALAAGALGAGLSGCGPAVAAIFNEPTRLPEVTGGTWTWTRVQPATHGAEVKP